jgi:hypothetical protein
VISIERLHDAETVEDLISSIPTELEIVSSRISIAEEVIKYSETKLDDHNLPDMFQGVHAGHKIFVEYIRVHKPGSKAQPISFSPLELVVVE